MILKKYIFQNMCAAIWVDARAHVLKYIFFKNINYINSHKLPNISFQFNRKNPVLTFSTIIIGGCTIDF